jgi:hypothetical protein
MNAHHNEPIRRATREYERWLGERMPLIRKDLIIKHEKMARGAFEFLRGSFFRWVMLWPARCAELAAAPQVLAIGDLHVENFGTWRDAEDRLVWGVNDFDEAATLPFTNDLVRLGASALLAIDRSSFAISPRRACEAIAEGYYASLKARGSPLVLTEHRGWLRHITARRLEAEQDYWEPLLSLRTERRPINAEALRLLRQAMPKRGLPFRVVHRQGGLGSLGRERFTALADYQGAPLAREAKALTHSAWFWRQAPRSMQPNPLRYSQLMTRAVRRQDPSVTVTSGWVVRRIAPDCHRIEIADLQKKRDVPTLLRMMGWEAGNIHLGSPTKRIQILRDLDGRKDHWLQDAAERMVEVILQDWREWRRLQ